ncbi:RES family NAD+ phosphorylase [Deinococcus radiophilus]|uniref:RES family NAD+ phosphorylase n=1 Tax=Deinococcus radiophilus TaxID=32062 RepID=UPI001E2C1CF6|nr:RES family NAD+ phosphorylase [Deinococcus radiophilus]UFA51746.1 RES family NAD+ phosphorylase [Deinococcus radiophilus]
MTLTLYRVSKVQYAQSPDLPEHGFGAARFGGRWNSPDPAGQADRRVIYASDTLAQAMLEVVVHVDSKALRSVPHAYLRFEVNEDAVAELDVAQLPQSWNAHPETPATQVIGDQWFDEQVSPVLRVPSVILPLDVYGPGQSNYLIHARHPQVAQAVRLVGTSPLPFDPRL